MKRNPLGALALCALLSLGLVQGCAPQATLAALTNELGTASASIAALEGNTALAQKITADTAAATQAIQNWKSGTPAQNVIEALNLVTADLNLICSSIPGPQCQEYEPLITLALGTVASIIAILNPDVVAAKLGATNAYPKTAEEFKTRWNGIVAANSTLAPLTRK